MQEDNTSTNISSNTAEKENISPENKKRLQWGSTLVTILLSALIVVSGVQSFQSFSVLEKIKSGELKAGNSGQQDQLPSNLKDLPNMVGGC